MKDISINENNAEFKYLGIFFAKSTSLRPLRYLSSNLIT